MSILYLAVCSSFIYVYVVLICYISVFNLVNLLCLCFISVIKGTEEKIK